MSRVIKTFAKTKLYSAGRDYYATEPGWAAPDCVFLAGQPGDIFYRNDIFYGSKHDIYANGQYWPGFQGIEEVRGIAPRMYHDQSQTFTSAMWTLSANGTWKTVDGAGEPGQLRISQENKAAGIQYVARSKFSLCRQPAFAIRLYRDGVDKDADWTLYSKPPETWIIWGVPDAANGDVTLNNSSAGFALKIPYSGQAMLYERRSGQWVPMQSGPIQEKAPQAALMENPEGGTHGDAGNEDKSWYIYIANASARIIVSQDGYEKSWVCNRSMPEGKARPMTPTDGILVNEGPIEVRHCGGGFWFSFIPMKPVASPHLDIGPFDPGYAPAGTWYENSLYWGRANDDGTTSSPLTTTIKKAGETIRGGTITLSGTQIAVHCEVDSDLITRTHGGVTTYGMTMAHWLQPWVWPVVEATLVAPTGTFIKALGVEVEYGEERQQRASMTLPNEDWAFRTLEDYRKIEITSGETFLDGTTRERNELIGLTYNPRWGKQHNGQATVDVSVVDFSVDWSEDQAEGSLPIFDGWLITNVYKYLALRGGHPEAYQSFREIDSTHVKMTDTPRLPVGLAGSPQWVCKAGAETWTFLKEVAQYDHFSQLFFEWRAGETYPQMVTRCRPYTLPGSPDHTLQASASVSSYGDDLMPQVSLSRESSRRKNTIYLIALDVWGRPYSVAYVDWVNLASVGRRKPAAAIFTVYADSSNIIEQALWLGMLCFQEPLTYEVNMPVRADIAIDQVVKLVATDSGYNTYPMVLNNEQCRVIAHAKRWTSAGQDTSRITMDKAVNNYLTGRFSLVTHSPVMSRQTQAILRAYGDVIRGDDRRNSALAGQAEAGIALYQGVTPTQLTAEGSNRYYWRAQGLYGPPGPTVNDGIYAAPGW